MDKPPSAKHRLMVQGLSPARKGAGDESPVAAVTPAIAPFRIGHGYDIHRLQQGGKLILAGVQVSDQISPVAHSDGDVVIHAIVDALLGAMGWGDIGEHFSTADSQWKDADSGIFLRTIHDRAVNAGFRVSNLDITIIAERPKLSPHKLAMVQKLRETLGPAAVINIKAGTNEECDSIGRGEAIAAHAVLLLMQSA